MGSFENLSRDKQIALITDLAHKALAYWGLRNSGLELIKYRENAVFKVIAENSEKYALRLHRPGYHSDTELRSELQWIDSLQHSDIDVPDVIPSTTGELLVTVKGDSGMESRQADLFAWVEGDQLGSLEDGLSGDRLQIRESFLKIGEVAAALHNHTTAWELPEGFERHAWDLEGLVGDEPFWGPFWTLDCLSITQRELLEQARNQSRKDLLKFGVNPENYSLIHADFVPENLLVEGEIVRLIDFDDAGFGWHMFEIATALYFIQDDPNYSVARDALIEGYRHNRELAESDIARLDLFLTLRGFTYLGWVQSRSETETAQELTPYLVEMACKTAERYLDKQV